MLLEMIRRRGVEGASVLDVGAGIGIVDRELLRAGAASAVLVDGSAAYLDVARAETDAEGLGERVRIVLGDFTRLAPELPAADVVTLDRVICCYPDVDALVDLSAARAAFERALAIDEKTFGKDHPDVATDVNNLAGVYYALGDLPAARANYERALNIMEEYAPNNPNTKTARENLAQVVKEMEQGGK